jgi:hypothetical protein
MGRVDDEVRTLLGPGSVAADKDKSGRQLDMIGWLIDLNAQLVTISDRNFDKTVHAFFSCNINEPITLHQVQVMDSLASRYTQISVLIKVHVWALYEFQQTFRSHRFSSLGGTDLESFPLVASYQPSVVRPPVFEF